MSITSGVVVFIACIVFTWIGSLVGRMRGYHEGWDAAKQVFCTWHKEEQSEDTPASGAAGE